MTGPDAATFASATEWLARRKRPLLVTHRNPDGDALGSLAAARLIFGQAGLNAMPVLFDRISSRYALFDRFEPMPIWKDIDRENLDVDAVVLLDTCSKMQIEPVLDWLLESKLPTLAVDHHVTRDDLAELYLVDETAGANCLILYEWAKSAGWRIDADAAQALWVGIAMDTGWFRFSNTDARVLDAAAGLVRLGANPTELGYRLFQREKAGRVRLLGEALGSLELLLDDRLAIMTLDGDAFRRADAAFDDTEDIVNEPLRIESVVVSVLLVDRGDGVIRTSLRSKEPMDETGVDVDVAAIAASLGGGGHRRAAGVRVQQSLADTCRAVSDLTAKALAER